MKYFTTEATWPVRCPHILLGAQLQQCTEGHLPTPQYKRRVERDWDGGWYSCRPLSASVDLPTAGSRTLSRRQGNQPQESRQSGSQGGPHAKIKRIIWRGGLGSQP